jgi:hypothetical protein
LPLKVDEDPAPSYRKAPLKLNKTIPKESERNTIQRLEVKQEMTTSIQKN